jgi:uncharacterized protein YuzB (UPF0349 family)
MSEVLRDLDTDGVDIRERRCLEHCGICRDRPFILVDGQLVEGTALATALDSAAGPGESR